MPDNQRSPGKQALRACALWSEDVPSSHSPGRPTTRLRHGSPTSSPDAATGKAGGAGDAVFPSLWSSGAWEHGITRAAGSDRSESQTSLFSRRLPQILRLVQQEKQSKCHGKVNKKLCKRYHPPEFSYHECLLFSIWYR